MTLPASPTNNQGGFYTTNIPVNPAEGATPPAPGVPPTPPNSPDSTSGTANGHTSSYGYVHTITSTQEAINGTGPNVAQQGSNVTSGAVSVSIGPASQYQAFKWQ